MTGTFTDKTVAKHRYAVAKSVLLTQKGDRAEMTEALICVGGTQEERASYGVYLGELWKRTVL